MRLRQPGLQAQLGILCLFNRATFAGVLLPWFLIGGLSKLAGTALSVGPAIGGLPLALGAYFVYAPWQVGFMTEGLAAPGYMVQVYVGLMVFLELALPILIAIGWKTRVAAAMLALHQLTSMVLLQPAEAFGALFDASPFDMMPDQLLLWASLVVPLALFGAGPLSMDALLRRIGTRRNRGQSTL